MGKLITTDSLLTYNNTTGTDTLQGAINAAIISKKPLFIAAGTYDLTANITINGSVKIFGARNSTIIRTPTNAAQAFIINVGYGSGTSRISDVTIEGLTLQGADKAISGHNSFSNPLGLITAKYVDRLIVRECFFQQSQGAGVQATGCTGVISDNETWSCRSGIRTKLSTSIVIERNLIRDSKDNGINVERVDPTDTLKTSFEGAVIRANRIFSVDNNTGGSGQFGNGIVCTFASGVTITENITSYTNYSGIRLNACSTSIVSNNQLYEARETALFVESLGSEVAGYEGVIVSGNVIDRSGNGIAVVNPEKYARRVSVTGNSVANLTVRQFEEWGAESRDPAVSRNAVTEAIGIRMAGADIVCTGNTLEACAGLGLFVYSAGDWIPGEGQTPGTRRSNASVGTIVANNLVKSCRIGIGFNDWDNRGHAEIAGNMMIGSNVAHVRRVGQQGQDLAGETEAVGWNTPASDRYSFSRNKGIAGNS